MTTLTLTELATHYRQVRARTLELAAPLSPEDAGAQSMPDASPAKWHLAHSTWFFETFVLERFEPGFRPFDPAFRVLFNSYYNAVGDKHPRPQRGLLTRPSLDAVKAYRAEVDRRVLRLLDGDEPAALSLVELGLHHEQQHQELLLTDVLHLFSCNPLLPAYSEALAPPLAAPQPMEWLVFAEGLIEIGHAGEGFAFDNEGPRHITFVPAFALASRLVSQGEYAGFIDAGGYRDPALWLSEGWDWLKAQGREHPLYWRRGERGWHTFTLHGLQPLDVHAPVQQVSYYEADAYARWAGMRLPTEAEWEAAAQQRRDELLQLDDACWQWTASAYLPYPGFRVSEGAVGEYNGKFMVNQMVLRGGSIATPRSHVRVSYRNFFPAGASWQFSGIRLAR
ncbi:MAG TPA: ergothioneine biosynthesis protein EgtB [Rhizobacter sp.]|nr:ergothioneine biosynthesis protein EgtB [Rhizobacter sp.]